MIDTQGKNRICIVGYRQATITNEYLWWLSEEFDGEISVAEPSELTLDDSTAYIVSITRDLQQRRYVAEMLQGHALVTFIHHTAVRHGHCFIDAGCFVAPYVGIYFGAKIGPHCLLGPNSMISHNVVIGQNTLIHPGVLIAGSSQIGNNCLLGIRSTVIDKISICDNVFVGAGSLVTKDIDEPGEYMGSPARRKIQGTE